MPTDSPSYVPVARPIDARTSTEALYRAVSAARYAPSADNAQPWQWRLSDDGLDATWNGRACTRSRPWPRDSKSSSKAMFG